MRSVRRDAAAHRNARALPGERRQVMSVERAVPVVGAAGAQLLVVARRHRLGARRLAAAAPPARRRDVRPHDRRESRLTSADPSSDLRVHSGRRFCSNRLSRYSICFFFQFLFCKFYFSLYCVVYCVV